MRDLLGHHFFAQKKNTKNKEVTEVANTLNIAKKVKVGAKPAAPRTRPHTLCWVRRPPRPRTAPDHSDHRTPDHGSSEVSHTTTVDPPASELGVCTLFGGRVAQARSF